MKSLKAILILLLAIIALLAIVGCSRFDVPTASQASVEDDLGLWNPAPGELLAGHEIPRLEEGYWESVAGPAVNPWMLNPRPVPIGPAGGIVMLGFHALIVPPGAVDHVVWFTVRYASSTGIAVDCDPSPMTFNVPVTLILSFFGSQYDRDNVPDNLGIYYQAEDGSRELQPSLVDRDHRVVIGQVTHFSRYILG